MKKLKLIGIVFASLLFGLSSCVDVERLSDDNSITSVKVDWKSDGNVKLGEPELGTNTIVIPVLYGKNRFPLTVRLSATFSPGIDRVVGVEDFYGDLVFTLDENGEFIDKEFIVQAESGLPRKYVVSFIEEPHHVAEQIPIDIINVSPAGSLVFDRTVVSGGELYIYAVQPEFPFSITPLFKDDNLEFLSFTNGETVFDFETKDDYIDIIVKDKEIGSARDFKVFIKALDLVSGADGDYESTDIYNPDFSSEVFVGAGFGMKGYQIDNGRDSISVYLTMTQEAQFPVSLRASVTPSSGNTGFIGLRDQQEFSLESFDGKFEFYYVDIQTQKARHWRIAPVLYKELGAAEILSFTYSYTTNKSMLISIIPLKTGVSIALDVGSVDIYPQSRQIWLRATEINNPGLLNSSWWLVLADMQPVLSEGATIDQDRLPNPRYEGKGAWEQSRSYFVIPAGGTAEDAVEWTLNIRDYRDHTPSGSADITGVSIASLLPVMAKANALTPVTLDEESSTVTINITEDEGCYPMTVRLDYELSDYAIITSQNNGQDPLVFDSAETVNQVTVTAEDGTTKVWNVKLNVEKKSAGANVSNFVVNTFSSSISKVSAIDIDSQNSVIEISLGRAGSFPTNVYYTMTLSRGATADIPLEGSIPFSRLTATKKFNVTASSGESKEWTVRFAPISPQLDNYTLEAWSENNPTPKGTSKVPYWATSNNTFKTELVVRTGGNGSGSAAKLETQSAPFVNIAAGSLFLGWFDIDKAMTYGTTDPVRLTFQGIEFSATRKLIAVEADISYTSVSNDSGTMTVEVIKHDQSKGEYVYHGKRPNGTVHPDNNADYIGRGQHIIGNSSIAGVTKVIPAGKWEPVRVDVNYGSNDPFDYTHLSIMFSSSSEGDSFIGGIGTTMLIDNIRLIYEGQ